MSHCRNAFAFAIVPTSRRQDGDGSAIHTHRNVRLSVTFLIIFALTFWLASVDWVMLLEPHWFSTIFGVYYFAGTALSTFAMMAIVLMLACMDILNTLRLHRAEQREIRRGFYENLSRRAVRAGAAMDSPPAGAEDASDRN